MKSFFIGLFVVCVCMQTALAQHTTNVPTPVKAAQEKGHKNASKVKWNKEGDNYEASFKYQNHSMSVLYAANGSVVETETAITTDELPRIALQYASAKGKITEAAKIVKANGTVQYEAEVKHKDLLFDDKGNFVTEKEDKD